MATQQQIDEFTRWFVPWGALDINRAVDLIEEHELDMEEIQEQIEQFCEECDVKIGDIDVVNQVYEHILQMARNKISEVLNYDFLNDATSGEICTYGNYMCTSFDYSPEALDELKGVLTKATQEQKEDMLEDNYFKAFISEIGIELEDNNDD